MSKGYQVIYAAVLAVILFAGAISAQPEQTKKADTLLAEAKTFIAENTLESIKSAIPKLETAASIFKTANDAAKIRETDLEWGKALRILGSTELSSDHDAEALKYFEAALVKLKPHGASVELAFTYHNLGYVNSRLEKLDDAVAKYALAADVYRALNDREGEASVHRNLGSIKYNQRKFKEAIELFTSAGKLSSGDTPAQFAAQAQAQIDIGDCERELKNIDDALLRFKVARGFYLKASDRKGEATAYLRIADIYAGQYNYKNALENYSSAYSIYSVTKDYGPMATTGSTIGGLHLAFGKYAPAEEYLSLAAEMFRILEDKASEGTTALDLAIAYRSLYRTSDARASVERAIDCFRQSKNIIGEAFGLLVDAEFLSFLNKHDDALAKIKEAEKIFAENKNPGADFRIARSYSSHYYYLSNYGEAIRYGKSALAMAEKDEDDNRISSCLVDIANTYSALGQNQISIAYTQRALAIAQKRGNRYTESISRSNIGYDYFLLNKLPDAEQYLKQAIAIMRTDGYEGEEGYAVHNLGLVYFKQAKYAAALENYDRAMVLYLKTGDRRPEAFLYQSLGELYSTQGQFEKGAENLQKAILLAREIRYSNVEATALGNMMTLASKRNQPRLAILYGKQAVNLYQAIRVGNRSLDKASQKSFVQTNEGTYRTLANLLIDEGRLAEAQQVFDLLKEEEFMEFVRRDASEAVDQAKLALTDSEKSALDKYSQISGQLTALGARFQVLQDAKAKAGGKLSPAEETEFQSLKTQIEEAGVGVRTFLSKLTEEFSKKVEDKAVITPESIESLRADLRRAGNDIVLVSTYLLPERYRAIVTTGRTMVDRKVEYADRKLTAAEINRKIAEFQRALQNPRVDPRPLGKELYDIFVKPLEADLAGANAKTILWSLDGTLRYIPMAALSPDGKTFLAEKYQNVLVTLARQTNLFAKPAADEWRALGAGVSKPHQGFSALPSVINELNSIVRDSGTTGVLDGKKLVDEKFDIDTLRATLPQTTVDGKPFNVIHLATHFKLGANDQDSALLLGDGKRLSLFEISKDEELDFKDVELLALSACETGVAAGDGSGREVESLGMLAQKKGAKAVLATLWKVADEGTSMFMSEFYRLKKADPKLSKAEAIRLAQKEMIDGKIKSMGQSGGCRADDFGSGGKPSGFKCDPNAPFSHPYFWSPFVLIGNWR